MVPFLQQVVDYYYNTSENFSNKCFIFPNRRSIVFFRKYIVDAISSKRVCAGIGEPKPMILPQMYTINDFFIKSIQANLADKITLLVILYDCYKKLNEKAESLDEFVYWGDVLLGDFNDVDKYLVDPKKLFQNISDLKALQDDFSYLTPNQRQAIETFINHFKTGTLQHIPSLNSESKNVKEEFKQIWNIMLQLYEDFNRALEKKNLAYEGKIYRQLVTLIEEKSIIDILDERYPNIDSYCFVGLNALNECEKKLLKSMQRAGIAEFCWDYSSDMIKDEHNKSSLFMSQNIKDFPQAINFDIQGLPETKFNILSVPSSYGQTKHVNQIIQELNKGKEDIGLSTAVILPDETLLMPLLNSLDTNINNINVTMGYPMSESEIYVLMSQVNELQLNIRKIGSEIYFYHKQVWNLFSNGLFKRLIEDKQEAAKSIARIKKEAKSYIHISDLRASDEKLFELIFTAVLEDKKKASKEQLVLLANYQQAILTEVAIRLAQQPEMHHEIYFAKEYYGSINRLKVMDLDIIPTTYFKLLSSILFTVYVPFNGEPLKGLQIMGPLETRALDFNNIIILSTNEGIFPRRSVSSSFIPPELRKGFSLPTYEYQDAVWAYYFYRLISRAENVWMLYDSSAEGIKSGEESRYIKQLRYHYGVKLNSYISDSKTQAIPINDDAVIKTPEIINDIKNLIYSASSIQKYINCPMQFYYSYIEKLKKQDEVVESMDFAMIGTVYHKTMQALYFSEDAMRPDVKFDQNYRANEQAMSQVDLLYLKKWVKETDKIKQRVISFMKEELNTDVIEGGDLIVQSVIMKYVIKTIEADIKILQRARKSFFTIRGLERKINTTLYGLKFTGVIDRVDSLGTSDVIRLSDYKSGSDNPNILDISDDKVAKKNVDLIFHEKGKIRGKHKAGLQFFIYDKLIEASDGIPLSLITNTMYAVSVFFKEDVLICPTYQNFLELMDIELSARLAELQNPNVPFERTQDVENCTFCDFKMICGR